MLPAGEAARVVPEPAAMLLSALLRLQGHALSAGLLEAEACALLRHVCQALVNEWDEQERRAREREQREASLYRSRSRLHGGGLTEDQQEERDFRRAFPTYHKDFADITAEPSLEQPIIIEDDEDCDGEAESSESSGSLLASCHNTVIQVHQRLCTSYAKSLWYRPSLPANQSKVHISALVTSYQITAPLIARFYHVMDCDLDPQLMGSHLLLSSLLQNTVRGCGGPAGLLLSSEGPYDFYREPNMSQARLCLPALEQLGRAVRRRLDDWPDHPALLQITVVMERILNFSLSSPLAKFLNGLEILLNKAQDWENNASRSVSLRTELDSITQLIIQWRKLELKCWSSSLDNAMKRHAENSNKHWFSIYQLVERYLQEKRNDSMSDGGVEELSLSAVSSTLQGFMEGSTLGQFHARLAMLLAFHCHVLLAPKQEGHALLCGLLWNLHKYYAQFSESVQSRIAQLRTPLERELKEFVKISKWNDVSFWSVKQSVEKTHRTLFRFTRKFEAVLAEPCAPCLVEQGSGGSLDSIDLRVEERPLHRLHQALSGALPGRGGDLQGEAPEELASGAEAASLQARLPFLTRRMRKMCARLVRTAALPELTEDLDQFTVEIITNVQTLQGLSVDRSLEPERQRAEVKHILLQKRRALADLFKMLAHIGLSYRRGLTWARTADAQEPLCLQPVEMGTALSVAGPPGSSESTLFSEMTSAWDGCQKYFYRSWARRNALQAAMQTAAKELGLGSVERCRGFSSHLFRLLLRQRRRLARLTDLWVQLRKRLASVRDVRSRLSRSAEDGACVLPPQEPVQGWVTRARSVAHQCCVALRHVSWTLQCCPEGPSGGLSQPREGEAGQGEATLSHPSPLAPHLQPPASLMRRGDPAWQDAVERAEALRDEGERLKERLNALEREAEERAIHTWSHVEQCGACVCSLGALTSRTAALEQLFAPEGTPVLHAPPGLSRGLHAARGEVEACVSEFSAWRTQLPSAGQTPERPATPFRAEFSEQVERTINTVLCAVQNLVKRREREGEEEQQADSRKESDSEACEELLKPAHLSHLMEEELSSDVACLALPEVVGVMDRLLEMLRCRGDSGPPHDSAELREACGDLVRLEPVLGVYSQLARWYLAVCMSSHRSTGKLLSVLASVFTDLAQKGFCLPQELTGGGDGEGATEFHDYEGGGIGEGEGVKDVSDKIENEDQVEDTFREGQEKEEEEPDQRDVGEEDDAIEMSEDFDGKTYDGEARETGEDEEKSDEEDEELDKKMGDLGDGPTDTLDERMWGDEDDDDDNLDSDKEQESGPGMDQGESELVAKDDNAEAGESNKDQKKRDEEKVPDGEDQREEVHEQVDEREFDENEVDPYHGNQEKRADPEGMDLPEELNLDQDEEGGEEEEGEEEGENPHDIADMELDGAAGEAGQEEEGGGDAAEEQQEGRGAEEPEEEVEGGKEAGLAEGGGDSESDERGESEGEDDDENRAREEEGREEAIPADQGNAPKEEEAGGEDEEDAPVNSAERKEHAGEGQTGEENVQSDTAMELAGAASERDQAKEEQGSGTADASQAEGHDSKLTARMSSQRQREKRTQSFKRKPGRADNERSLGDTTERVHKRLRTVERTDRQQKEEQRVATETPRDSDLYEHVGQGEEQYDTQTYDTASREQQRPAGVKPEVDGSEDDDDVAMDTEEEEDLQTVEAPELKPERPDGSAGHRRGLERGEPESQREADEEEEEEKAEPKSSGEEEERRERSRESTIHTVPELLTQTLQLPVKDPELLRRELELQLEEWQRQGSGPQEEEREAAGMWQQYQALTSALSQELCEQLRLILEPTQAAKLKGDYRTGKRLNMRKVIPYIASQFRKDRIWLRRTKPSKREYQICLAVDDSSSMVDNHSKQMAFESVSVIVNALTLLEVGQVAVCSFGESVQLLHPFHQQFSDQSGARILRLCQFRQKKTRIAQFLETSASMFVAAKQQNPSSPSTETAQLLLIVSDGRGLFLEGKERVAAAVQSARGANVFVIFVVLDNPNSRDSILDIKVPIFKGPGELPEIRSYMEEFPFPFYVILRDVNALPQTLSDALRQWFELVTATDQ